MPEVVPADGFAQMKAWMRKTEQRLDKLETARRLENASLSGGAFSVLDPATLAEQVRLGLQDDGSYGLNVVGGRLTVEGATVDAITFQASTKDINGASLDTTLAQKVSTTLTAPTWANRAVIIATIVFRMTNVSGAPQTMRYRTDVNGQPGEGAWNHTVENAFIANQTAQQVWPLTSGVPGSTITVDAIAAVDSGTNNTNIIRVIAQGTFFRV